MKIKIKETNETKYLNLIDGKTNVDWVCDFIGNTGAFCDGQFAYDDEEEVYVCDQETYDWWSRHIVNFEEMNDKLDDLNDDLQNIDDDEIDGERIDGIMESLGVSIIQGQEPIDAIIEWCRDAYSDNDEESGPGNVIQRIDQVRECIA